MEEKDVRVGYIYGMRLRPFGIGCQPMEGYIERRDAETGSRYWDRVVYDRRLTDEEISHYSLDFLGKEIF